MQITPQQLKQYWTSRKNIFSVVRYRGYDIDDDFVDLSFEEFSEEFHETTLKEMKESISDYMFERTMTKGKGKNTKDKIIVRWHIDHKLGPSIRGMIDMMKENDAKRCIIVADGGSTPMCKDIIKNIKSVEGMIVDVWDLDDSQIFVPNDIEGVPAQRICTVQEKMHLMRVYGLSIHQIPDIPRDDVIVKYLGAARGDLIESLRISQNNPDAKELYYRIVK